MHKTTIIGAILLYAAAMSLRGGLIALDRAQAVPAITWQKLTTQDGKHPRHVELPPYRLKGSGATFRGNGEFGYTRYLPIYPSDSPLPSNDKLQVILHNYDTSYRRGLRGPGSFSGEHVAFAGNGNQLEPHVRNALNRDYRGIDLGQCQVVVIDQTVPTLALAHEQLRVAALCFVAGVLLCVWKTLYRMQARWVARSAAQTIEALESSAST